MFKLQYILELNFIISNLECPPFDFYTTIIQTCLPSTVLYVIHVDLYDYKLKSSVPHVQLLIVIHS